jgi:hypothetical protein
VSQVYAGVTIIDPNQTSGCAVFPASAAAIEYLVVPQSASAIPDVSQAFKLGGNPLAAPPLASPWTAVAAPSVAQQFDLRLRLAERELAAQVPRPLKAPARVTAAPMPVVPGAVRTFKVCNTALTCDPRKPSTLSNVTATALSVGTHIAIFVDNAAPQNGLAQSDLDNLRTLFDTRLYETDTLAFGRESDIDNNGMVIVVMTGKVNSVVSRDTCLATGFVAGFFFGADLITTPPFATGNNGEIFYSIVADPTGSLSCAHPVSEVTQLVPVTFVHEFQHMISFNQHFLLRRAPPEDLWLNEGLSHYAEEHGGRTFLPDTGTFCNYVFGDLDNSGQYFSAPQNHFLVDTAGIGGQPERGAYWLFVRYLVDQFSTDTSVAAQNSFTRTLEATTLVGAGNVSAATGTNFAILLERWALANYVSDLSGFPAPPELQYVTWQFRSAFPTLRTACGNTRIPSQFPLDFAAPVFNGSTLAASGVLHAGSGSYYRLQQAAGDPQFSLLFSNGAGAALRTSLVPRLNVIRIQ